MLHKEIIIKSQKNWSLLDLSELIRYRELFLVLTWRDIKVRYKQTALGIIWVLFQPLMSMGIFTILFGKLAKIPSNNMPYELFVFIGLVFWNFFANSLTMTSNSLIDNANIIKKIYFPKIILPISAVLTNSVDFGVNFIAVLLMMLYFHYIPSLLIVIVLPIAVLITILSASGIGFFLASVNVKYRDVRYILPFFIQILIFLTPVIYPSSIVRDNLRLLFAINPMTGVIESMRTVVSGSNSIDLLTLLISSLSSIILFFVGYVYFIRTERFFVDRA